MPAGQLLILVAFVAIFWFLLIRPQKNKQKELQRLQSEVTPGSRVMLTSGIFGTVTAVDDQRLTLEVAEGVRFEVLRGAIAQVVPGETDETDEIEQSEDADATEAEATEGEATEAAEVTEATGEATDADTLDHGADAAVEREPGAASEEK